MDPPYFFQQRKSICQIVISVEIGNPKLVTDGSPPKIQLSSKLMVKLVGTNIQSGRDSDS